MKLRLLSLRLLLTGMLIFAYSLTLPYYKNNKAPYEVVPDDSVNYKDEYYKYEETYRTKKTNIMNFGSGLCVAAITFLVFFAATETRHLSDLNKIKTKSITSIFLVANAAWLLNVPGTYWYYTFRAGRGDYPPFSDNIGIPIYTQVPVILFLLIPFNIFILFCIANSKHPATLLSKPANNNWKSRTLEILFGLLMLINLLCLLNVLLDGDHFFIVCSICNIYILLSLRAGIINNYNTKGISTSGGTELS